MRECFLPLVEVLSVEAIHRSALQSPIPAVAVTPAVSQVTELQVQSSSDT
jgi:hypothetical protein